MDKSDKEQSDDLDFWMNSDNDEDVDDTTSDIEEKPKREKENQNSFSKKIEKTAEIIDGSEGDDSPNDFESRNKRNIRNDDDNDYEPDNDFDDFMNQNGNPRRISTRLHTNNSYYQREVDVPIPPLKTIPEKDPNSTAVLRAKNDLLKTLENLEKDIDDFDEKSTKQTIISADSSDSSSDVIEQDDINDNPVKKKIILRTADDTFEWKLHWFSKDSFVTLLESIPEKFRSCNVIIDGISWTPDDMPYDMVHNGDILTLTQPIGNSQGGASSHSQGGNEQMRKITFLLPDGTRKKTKVQLEWTWGEALKKLGVGKSLIFDGEVLDLEEKIGENDEIQDEDQVDIEE